MGGIESSGLGVYLDGKVRCTRRASVVATNSKMMDSEEMGFSTNIHVAALYISMVSAGRTGRQTFIEGKRDKHHADLHIKTTSMRLGHSA